jgi:hypothetical protein
MNRDTRRGAVLVMAALLMVVVLSILVVVVDISRIYVLKSELQTGADAAALAGVMELAEGAPTQMVQDTAITYGGANNAGGAAVTIVAADIRCGTWDDDAGSYTNDSGTCGVQHNAVTVTARANSTNSIPGILAGIFPIKATGRAYAAYIGASKCIKPWAIPYAKLTTTLQPLNTDTLRDLDETDIELLKQRTKDELTFTLKIGTPPDAGNFGSLYIPSSDPDAPNGGANLYEYNITDCNPTLIGIGDTLETQTGNIKGPTTKGIQDLCMQDGTYVVVGDIGTCYDSDGNVGIPVKAALWSQGTWKSTGNFAVIVRQIVSFVFDNYNEKDAIVTGHFLPLLTDGSITVTPTTVQRPILIK